MPEQKTPYVSECPLCGAEVDAEAHSLPDHLRGPCPEVGPDSGPPTIDGARGP